MKKLMKKKVSLLGKEVSVFAIVVVAMIGLASAMLVPYLSNTITGNVVVESPIELEITDASDSDDTDYADVVIDGDNLGYTISLHGGESFWIKTTLTNHVDGITGYIGESKIFGFDGAGMTLNYVDIQYPNGFEVDGCTDGTDWYFYIGNPNDVLPEGVFTSTTTVTTDLNLEPKTYTAETKVVPEADIKCGSFKP